MADLQREMGFMESYMESNMVKNILKSGVLLLLLSAVLPLYAEEEAPKKESPVSAQLQTHIGMFFGGMTEYVYEEGRAHELSRLEWEENFVPYVAIAGDFSFRNFFVDVGVITAIPVRSGFMKDYDFMLPGSDAASHFSRHDALFDKHLEISPKIGYTFDFGDWRLSPQVGFLYRNRKWSAVDGYVQYPRSGPWTEDAPKQDMAGVVISYEELIWFPTVTLSGSYTIKKRYDIGLTATYYPYLHVDTVDSHMLRSTRFHDTMKGGWGGLGELSVTYVPRGTDLLNFIFAVGFEGIYPPKGSTASGAIGYDDGLIIDKGYQSKMESSLWWVSLGVTMYPQLMWNK
jgi:outer membrane protease